MPNRHLRLLVLVAGLAPVAAAQTPVTERPAPFDSAARILSINPNLGERLGLTAPAWPVSGEFVEARLFSVSDGGFVISVLRPGGIVDRYHLTDDQAAALRRAMTAGVTQAGRAVSEDAASLIAEPARGPFVRDQMFLATVMYGPALASLPQSSSSSGAAYMLAVGGTFFIVNGFAQSRAITKAQNSLTTDGAIRGWLAARSLSAMVGQENGEHAGARDALLGGMGGSIIGYNWGRNLTHSEAQASMTGSTIFAGTAVGLSTALGIVGTKGNDNSRSLSGALLAGGIAGYIVGPAYPRRARYTVTAGDISLVRLSAYLGAATASIPLWNGDVDSRLVAGMVTAGWTLGAVVGDRAFAKPFNVSSSDARMIQLGAIGGGLLGGSLPVMARTNQPTVAMLFVTGGAIIGTAITTNAMNPSRQGSAYVGPTSGDRSALKFDFTPENLGLAMLKRPGNYSLLNIRF